MGAAHSCGESRLVVGYVAPEVTGKIGTGNISQENLSWSL